MRFHVDVQTAGPVTASAVRDAIEHAIDRQRLNVGLSADGDEGAVTGFTVTIAEGAAKPKPIRIRCTNTISEAIKNVSYVTKDARRGWSCVLANGTPAAMSYAGVRGDEIAATFELDDAADVAEILAILRRLGGPTWAYEAV